jgi:intracellular septation protein
MSKVEKPARETAAPQNTWVKLTIEMGPLILFFVVNGMFGIFAATGAFMIAIVASMIFSWRLRGHIPPMLWFTGAVVMVFGGLTLYLADETFIKLKPTIIYSFFAGILFFGLARGRSYLQVVMEAGFPPLLEAGWLKMARNWALFFTAAAIMNEIVWRNFSTDFWVSFKLFGFIPATMLFAVLQVPVIMKYQIEAPNDTPTGDDSAP